eukprot:2922928-Pleurochrysis_carterae.AAC.1
MRPSVYGGRRPEQVYHVISDQQQQQHEISDHNSAGTKVAGVAFTGRFMHFRLCSLDFRQ